MLWIIFLCACTQVDGTNFQLSNHKWLGLFLPSHPSCLPSSLPFFLVTAIPALRAGSSTGGAISKYSLNVSDEWVTFPHGLLNMLRSHLRFAVWPCPVPSLTFYAPATLDSQFLVPPRDPSIWASQALWLGPLPFPSAALGLVNFTHPASPRTPYSTLHEANLPAIYTYWGLCISFIIVFRNVVRCYLHNLSFTVCCWSYTLAHWKQVTCI